MDITNITDDMIGKKITCYIYDKFIEDAEITKEEDLFFVLQNIESGLNCKNKKGYKYFWTIGSNNYNLEIHLTKVRLKTPTEPSIELWI